MPIFSGGKDESPDRDQPFTGDGKGSNTDRKPDKGEVIVRGAEGSALLKSTNDLFKGKKNKK
jgi:hypothetical protein